MRFIRRVSPTQAIARISVPPPSSFLMTRWFMGRSKPYTLTTSEQLFKYGLDNHPHSPWLVLLAISAVCLGIALDQAEKQLMQNEVHTLYSYRLLDRTNSSLALYLRKLLFQLLHQPFVGQVFPLYEFKTLIGASQLTEEKIVRVRQFRYFQKRRDNRFDFLELGVLEKFPYPLDKEVALAD